MNIKARYRNDRGEEFAVVILGFLYKEYSGPKVVCVRENGSMHMLNLCELRVVEEQYLKRLENSDNE